ncbi:regulator protein [Acetobacter nitrogenifigens DSM 23921 = NBRC 105050]|uniref:Bacterial transcriptional activator domain-containing protein n=1 Tax=Acetobacter nitrogenifigens DSM 23921 = NBRC 105050 TaxID=1120919 RepID=A0A511X9H4_9PROT|nr:BTAD domain-containing putative transcriptional regulator [Acetobacter nitrogenifigens]GBQ93528.1 regulator protein [Acetobacter nitrogenifigens DSM 23921 = NBRC 105050]GEN59594.1 hypothetical protein ANI02nite_14780 [Acetobacter nitrogenifigens DSM 23921 = NBRC 105050]
MALFDLAKPGLRKSDAAILRVELLGATAAHMLDGTTITPTGAKTRGLLAILAMSDRRPVSRRALANLLWSRRSDEQARASLRQEIHRLADALSPLGADVIDVQRHALALKPVLTTVDVERYLNATPQNVLKLPEISGTLLSDLSNVDPALDEWLSQQRTRLHQHLIATFEQAMLYQSDPELRLTAATRVLKFDRLNENAWKTVLRELARRNDGGSALVAAEECLSAFRDALGAEPGAATMAIISDLKAARGGSPQPHSSPLASGANVPSTNADSALSTPTPPYVASIAFTSAKPRQDNDDLREVSEDIAESIATGLAQFSLLGVVPPNANDGPTPHANSARESKRQDASDADFLVEHRLQLASTTASAPDGTLRLLVRVTDRRRGGVIVWATRVDFAQSAIDSYVSGIVTEIVWRVALAEARSVASRTADELQPLQAGLRALALMTRGDPSVYTEASNLLHHALLHEPDHPFLLLVSGLTSLLQSCEQWDTVREQSLKRGVEVTRRLLQVAPDSISGKMLLGRLLLTMSREQTYGLALLEELTSKAAGVDLVAIGEAYRRLAQGQFAEAFEVMAEFQTRHATHPFTELVDSDILLIDLLAGRFQEAASWARARLSVTPTRTSLLLLHLAALASLNATGGAANSDEMQDVTERLFLIKPDICINAAVRRYTHLPEAARSFLKEALQGSGLPMGLDLPGLTQSDAADSRVLGGVTATGYEGPSQAGAVVPQQMR